MNALTQAERDTLNAAVAVLLAHTELKANWSICVQNFHGRPGADVTYFDTNHEQHNAWCGNLPITGSSFADKVQSAIDIQSSVNTDAEGYKARRIEQLRAEMASLGVAA